MISVAGSEISQDSTSRDTTASGKKKKKVTWAIEKELRSYHYFELDENERGTCNHGKRVAALL